MKQSDMPPPSSEGIAALNAVMSKPLPSLSRDARLRIEQGEKNALARYERDTEPYFPTNPSFSFLAADVYRSQSQIVGYIRIYAEEVLDVHLKEYLESSAADVAMHMGLRLHLADRIWKLTSKLWRGYRLRLWIEPTLRRARYAGNAAVGIPNQSPELETWRYPDEQAWVEFWRQAQQPDSEMAVLKARHDQTIQQAILDRVKHFEEQAQAKLELLRQSMEAARRRAEDQSRHTPNAAEPGSVPKSDAPAAVKREADARTRKPCVDAFIAACNQVSTFQIYKKHIWRAAGHRSDRPFQYWQANSPKATQADHRNFDRILSMEPSAFVALLKNQGIT